MQLHTEIPVFTLARLVHLRIPGFLLILGRGGSRDQRGIHDCALAQAQSAGGQMLIDAAEQDLAQPCSRWRKLRIVVSPESQAQTRKAPQRFPYRSSSIPGSLRL